MCLCVVLLCRLLNTFQSTLDEVSIIALPPNHSTGTASQAAAQRCVRLQSFYDPAKGVCFAQGQALMVTHHSTCHTLARASIPNVTHCLTLGMHCVHQSRQHMCYINRQLSCLRAILAGKASCIFQPQPSLLAPERSAPTLTLNFPVALLGSRPPLLPLPSPQLLATRPCTPRCPLTPATSSRVTATAAVLRVM